MRKPISFVRRLWASLTFEPATPARIAKPAGRRLRLERLEPRTVLAGVVAIGTDAGVTALVQTYADRDDNDSYETLAGAFNPFGAFAGGVRVALGDFDGDFNDELVTAAGPGGGPHVIIWDLNPDGTLGGVLDSFFAFGGFAGGVFVAAGDLNGDRRDELIVSAGEGGGPHVKVYSDVDFDGLLSDNLTDSFFAYAAGFAGGVRVAAGNTDGDALNEEIITAAGPGGGPHVRVWDDVDLDRAVSDNPLDDEFFAYAASFAGGVYVASGPSGVSAGHEIITGPGAGLESRVRVFSDTDADGKVSDQPVFDEFLAYGAFSGGVRVAAGDTDLLGLVELITAAGPGGGPHVKIFDDDGPVSTPFSGGTLDGSFFAFPAPFASGLFAAFGTVNSQTVAFGGGTQAVPDQGDPGDPLILSIVVPSGGGVIRDLDVSLFVHHTNDSDLDVALTHVASGTSVVFFTDVGADDDGFFIRLADEVGTDIGAAADDAGDRAVQGTFNLEGAAPLSAFDGLDASGLWQLTIDDDLATNVGTLLGWELHFTY